MSDFAGLSEEAEAHEITWTLAALPSTTVIGPCAHHLADPKFAAGYGSLDALASAQAEQSLQLPRGKFPVYLSAPGSGPVCVLLPLDRYFDVRARFAIRTWRALSGRNPGANPAALTRYRRDLLVTQLRALDGKLEGASHAQIAEALFAKPKMSASSWKSHDLRYRTDDAVHRGMDLMRGEYRQLLLHPYRLKVPQALLGAGTFATL